MCGCSRYRDGRLVDTRSEGFSANPGESTADLLRRAVAAIAPDIGAGREPEAAAPSRFIIHRPGSNSRQQGQTLTAVLPIDSLDDWLRARERLQAVPAIRKVTLAALSRQEATIAIDYTGTIEQLKSELAKISLNLVQRESRWRLARGGRRALARSEPLIAVPWCPSPPRAPNCRRRARFTPGWRCGWSSST